MKNSTIQVISGQYIDPLNPDTERINIEDIAHALSNVCRFTGHVREFYSVAQHSVLVSYVVPKEFALAGLMHDASEAYLADIASPVKPHLSSYYDIEEALMSVIAEKFGFDWPMHPEVRKADLILLATEKRDLLPAHEEDEKFWMFNGFPPLATPIYPYEPKAAKVYFLNRFKELTEGIQSPSRTMLVGVPNERC